MVPEVYNYIIQFTDKYLKVQFLFKQAGMKKYLKKYLIHIL